MIDFQVDSAVTCKPAYLRGVQYEMCRLWQARLDILKIHSRKMNLTRGINLRKIAEMMPGASGAEVKVSVKGHIDSVCRPFITEPGTLQRARLTETCHWLT